MNLLGKSIGGSALRNYPEESTQQCQPPSLLDGLKQQRDILAAKLAKTEDAIAAIRANPAIADVLQKLSNL